MSHPSEEWIQEVEASAPPEQLQLARRRHSEFSTRFQARAELDGAGFLQALTEIEGETGFYPGSPPTLRGKIGGWLMRIQGSALWWLLHSMRRRDRALRGAYDLICTQIKLSEASQRTMAREIQDLRQRLEQLERKDQLERKRSGLEAHDSQ